MNEVLPLEAMLVRFLRRNWRNEGEIADLRQEVYARVYEASARAIPVLTKPFLFMTARNLMIDRLRRAAVVSIESIADLEALDVAAEEATPEIQVGARQELKRLQAALDLLPPRCREVLVLRKIEGLSQRDVARRMGITEDTVEKQMSKAVRQLADALFDLDIPLGRAKRSRFAGRKMEKP